MLSIRTELKLSVNYLELWMAMAKFGAWKSWKQDVVNTDSQDRRISVQLIDITKT